MYRPRVIILRSGKVGDHAILACQLKNFDIPAVTLTSIRGRVPLEVYNSVGISATYVPLGQLRPTDTLIVFEHFNHGPVIRVLLWGLGLLMRLERPALQIDQYGQAAKVVEKYISIVKEASPYLFRGGNLCDKKFKLKKRKIFKILIAPHGSEPAKNLNSDSCNYLTVCLRDRLDKTGIDYEILIVPDKAMVSKLSLDRHPNVRIFNAPDLSSFLSVVSGADLVIGVDSSSIAIANMHGIPFVCLQGMRLNPEIWQANKANHSSFVEGYYVTDDNLACKYCGLYRCELANACVNHEKYLNQAVEFSTTIVNRYHQRHGEA